MATDSTQPEAPVADVPGAVADEAAAVAPSLDGEPPSGGDDESGTPTLVEDFEDLSRRITRSQVRIQTKDWTKRATSGNLPALVRDTFADEVLQLMKEMADMCADFGESFEKLDRVVDDLDYEVRKQGQSFREFVSGSVIAYSVVLAQFVLSRGTVDDEMRMVAQKIIDSMGAVNVAAGRPVVAEALQGGGDAQLPDRDGAGTASNPG
jgi:hypothetical protein